MKLIIGLLFSLLSLCAPAHAHWGHLGELAGHSHWLGLGAVVVAGVLAGLLGQTVQDAEETEPENEGETTEGQAA